MTVVVQKFGGTSVEDAERIMAAARRAIRAKQAGNQVIVVVSARGDTTDELIAWPRRSATTPPAREMDMLLATGEQISIALMAMAIQTLGERGHQLHRRPGRHRHRQHPHQGAHQEHLHRAACARRSTTARSSSSPASRASTRTTTSPRSAAAAPTPPPSPSPPS